MNKIDFAKIHAFDCVRKHLEESSNDPRKRERMRVQTALGHVNKWYKEGEQTYDKNASFSRGCAIDERSFSKS